MKIELRNVKFYERMSEETNAFVADIYVEGKKVGYAKNDGRGGCTEYHSYPENRQLFNECEKYCKTLPDHIWEWDGVQHSMKNNLEMVIDNLFEKWLKEKEQKKFQKQMETKLMWGVPNGYSYHYYTFKKPINTIDRTLIQRYIDKIKTSLKDGEVILNTNLQGFDV